MDAKWKNGPNGNGGNGDGDERRPPEEPVFELNVTPEGGAPVVVEADDAPEDPNGNSNAQRIGDAIANGVAVTDVPVGSAVVVAPGAAAWGRGKAVGGVIWVSDAGTNVNFDTEKLTAQSPRPGTQLAQARWVPEAGAPAREYYVGMATLQINHARTVVTIEPDVLLGWLKWAGSAALNYIPFIGPTVNTLINTATGTSAVCKLDGEIEGTIEVVESGRRWRNDAEATGRVATADGSVLLSEDEQNTESEVGSGSISGLSLHTRATGLPRIVIEAAGSEPVGGNVTLESIVATVAVGIWHEGGRWGVGAEHHLVQGGSRVQQFDALIARLGEAVTAAVNAHPTPEEDWDADDVEAVANDALRRFRDALNAAVPEWADN